ncbi:hypothetical protein BTM297_09330 [Helicobacter pylori]
MVGREPNETNPHLKRLIEAIKDMQKESDKGIKEVSKKSAEETKKGIKERAFKVIERSVFERFERYQTHAIAERD